MVKKIYESILSQSAILTIYTLTHKYNVSINIYSNDLWFTEGVNYYVSQEAKIIGEDPIPLKYEYFKQYLIHKILLIGTMKQLQLLKKDLRKFDNIKLFISKKLFGNNNIASNKKMLLIILQITYL